MRLAGFTIATLLAFVSVVTGQEPGVPPIAGAPGPARRTLDQHLDGWENTMRSITNFRFDLERIQTEPTFKTEKRSTGSVLCMKPNFAILRLEHESAKKRPDDYEAYICNGKSVFEYNGPAKTITEWKLPDPKNNPGGALGDNLMINFLSGMKKQDALARFDIEVKKEDATYVYLQIKPKLQKDKAEFLELTMALYGPNLPAANANLAYLPAQVLMAKPNGDTEKWTFRNPLTNLPSDKVNEKVFEFRDVPGYTRIQGQAQPPTPPGRPLAPPLPGATGLPAGQGAVRPK